VPSDPAGTLIVATPPVSAVADEVYVPLVSVTEPVGVGVPATVTVTARLWAVVMLDGEGETVTVGVVFAGLVTVTEAVPVALL
jgi:hypothetical protein